MGIFQSKGVVDRLQDAIAKASKAKSAEDQVDILYKAITTEIGIIKAITDMPGFRIWIEGERFDLASVRGRKRA